jgi:hypothetical protein
VTQWRQVPRAAGKADGRWQVNAAELAKFDAAVQRQGWQVWPDSPQPGPAWWREVAGANLHMVYEDDILRMERLSRDGTPYGLRYVGPSLAGAHAAIEHAVSLQTAPPAQGDL